MLVVLWLVVATSGVMFVVSGLWIVHIFTKYVDSDYAASEAVIGTPKLIATVSLIVLTFAIVGLAVTYGGARRRLDVGSSRGLVRDSPVKGRSSGIRRTSDMPKARGAADVGDRSLARAMSRLLTLAGYAAVVWAFALSVGTTTSDRDWALTTGWLMVPVGLLASGLLMAHRSRSRVWTWVAAVPIVLLPTIVLLNLGAYVVCGGVCH